MHFATAPHALAPTAPGRNELPATSTCTDSKPVSVKFGWLVQPNGQHGATPEVLEEQMQHQTEGWLESIAAVSAVVAQHGPFDGCIAFSQGCTIAVSMVALQELQAVHSASVKSAPTTETSPESPQQLEASAGMQEQTIAMCNWRLAFVMLCSGHVGVSAEAQSCVRAAAPLQTPSLHVYGSSGADRQVSQAQSDALAACFAAPCKRVHDRGHVIPAARSDVDAYQAFFASALGQRSQAAA